VQQQHPLPSGTRDVLPDEMRELRAVTEAVRAVFEARGYGILVDSEGGLFCGGDSGCVLSVKGNALYQTDFLVGVSGRF